MKNSVGLIHNNLRGLRKKYVHQNVEVCCFRKLQILIRIMMRGPYADPRPILNKYYKETRYADFFYTWHALLLFEGIEGIPMCALFFPLEFEGKIH